MNTVKFAQDVRAAISEVAAKHNVKVKVDKVARLDDHLETKLTMVEVADKPAQSKNSKRRSKTRKEQVRDLINKGVEGAKKIANKIGTHPSYVSRLITQVKNEMNEEGNTPATA